MVVLLLAVPAFANANVVAEEEEGTFHVILMILTFSAAAALTALSLKASGIYGHLARNAFRIMAAGTSMLALEEVAVILNHFGYIVWTSTADHALHLAGFAIMTIGFWKLCIVGKKAVF